MRKGFGQYIVADPKICGGELTFKGTRIFVKDMLEMVAYGIEKAAQKLRQRRSSSE